MAMTKVDQAGISHFSLWERNIGCHKFKAGTLYYTDRNSSQSLLYPKSTIRELWAPCKNYTYCYQIITSPLLEPLKNMNFSPSSTRLRLVTGLVCSLKT